MNLLLQRDGQASPNYGVLYADGGMLGQTLEDQDRYLENGGEKMYGDTAIPRGRYKIVLSMSGRFKKIMPELLSVGTHSGVRIHAGNDEVDTLGCPLLGRVRTATGIADCKGPNARLIKLLTEAELRGEESWIDVK